MKRWSMIVVASLIGCGSPEVVPTVDGEHPSGAVDEVGRPVGAPVGVPGVDAGDPPALDAGSAPDAGARSPGDPGPGDPDPGDADPGDPDPGDPADAGASDPGDPGDPGDPEDAGGPAPPVDSGPAVVGSPGCGRPASGAGAFVARTIVVRGVSRTYHLRVPTAYDPARAYPIVFKWHGAGGDGLSGGLGIEWVAGDDAIIVSGDGVGGFWDLDPAGSDVDLFDAMLAEVSGELCVDDSQVYSYGFSRGGGMTNLLACVRSGVLRGAASVAGLQIWGSASCGGPVATFLLHDSGDGAVPISHGVATRDRMVTANGCGATTTPTSPSPCVRYDGCAADPVVWCETTGYGHNIRGDFAPQAAWDFFRTLP